MIIFSPGPANISERVRNALMLPDISHRDSEFAELLAGVRDMVLKVCQVEKSHKCIIFNGSGTLAMESVLASFSGYKKIFLVISNGIYGERAANIGRLYGINIKEIRLPWGSVIDLNRINDGLKESGIGGVYIVHHETTTGLLNPLREVCHIARNNKKMVLVDGISSIAGEILDISEWGIDAIIGSANKCIRGVPGISFALVSQRFVKTVEKYKSRSLYADLLLHLNSENKGQTPFTPPVQVFYAFREALRELLEEGVDTRINSYRHTTGFLRQGLKRLGLKFYIPEAKMSNTMTALCLPEGYDFVRLHAEFKNRGFVIYASQGKLCEKTFRLGTVGKIFKNDIARFLKVFGGLLRKP